MIGRDHASLAALVTLGVGRMAGVGPSELLAITGCVAGASLLPDLDETGSSVARMAEPLSGIAAWLTGKLAGGHRQATHSLLAAGAAGLAVFLAGRVPLGDGAPLSVVPLAITYAITARALLPVGIRPGHALAVAIGASGAWAVWRYSGIAWCWWAVTAGVALHLVGDMITSRGVPLMWPSRWQLSLPVLGRTGGWQEHLVGLVLIAGVVALAWGPVGSIAFMHDIRI